MVMLYINLPTSLSLLDKKKEEKNKVQVVSVNKLKLVKKMPAYMSESI